MNKKVFKFLLYGTLMAASGSTVISCSNYDDDIKGLQEQITANATDLKSLVTEKINNVGTEIEALKSQQGKLAEAYKAADEESQKAAIVAAQAAIDAAIEELQNNLDEALKNTGTVEDLLLADFNLQTGINDAAELADKAYKLAENKADAKETADALKLIKQVLFGQTDITSSNVSNILKQISDNKANYTILNAALGELKKSSSKSIDSLANVSAQLKLNIEDCLKDAKKYSDDKIKLLLTDKLMDGGTQIATNTSISNLKLAYVEADKKLGTRIDSLAQKTKDTEDKILKIENKLSSISDCLNKSLNNLITGVILQDASQVQNVFAKVDQYSVNPGGGKIYFEAGTVQKAYFPYQNAKGFATLTLNQYNVETEGGKLYVTLNPNTIDFTDSELKLVNSLDNTAPDYTLSKAKASTRTTAIMTRATNVKNGLYEFDVTYNQIDKMKAPSTTNPVAYALMAEYKSYEYDEATGLKKEVNHKIYSKYELTLNATQATALTNSDITLECNGTELQTIGNNKVSGLTGTFYMKPAKTIPAKDGQKVYKKYLVCTKAVKSNGSTDNAAMSAINTQANMCTVLGESDVNFDNISVTIDETYNGDIFTIDYYIWNYNGSIVKNTYNVIFTKPMIEAQDIVIKSSPIDDNTSAETIIKNSEFSKTLCMSDKNSLWKSNAVEAKVEGTSSNCPITSIKFYDNANTPSQKGNTLSINSGIGEITFDASVAGAIKNMTIVYNPENLVIGKEYTFPIRFYNAQGNEVNTINVKFTMNRPNVLDSKIVRIPAAFQENDVTIAWAQYDDTDKNNAYYYLSGSYNNLTPTTKTLDTFSSYIRFEDPTRYTTANNSYKPSQEPLYSNGYKMIVPNAAVDADAQNKGANAYLYNMNAGVQYYDFANIWATTETFKIKFQSPIYHASFTLPKQNCEYRKSLDITNSQISSIDPSFTDLTNKVIYYFDDINGTRDSRIKKVTVRFEDPNDGNNGLFTNVDPNIDNTTGILLTTDGTAAITATDVNFIMSVEDVFGCIKEHKFTVRVVPNKLDAPKR